MVSIWEMQIKAQLKRLELRLPLPALIDSQRANGIQLLALQLQHIYALQELPTHHQDPFDRALIAQAKTESLVLMSSDSQLANYGVEMLW